MTQQLALGFEPAVVHDGFWLSVAIERYAVPISTQTFNVDGELLIGRSSSAGLLLDGALVSRRHLVVRAANDGLEIEDFSSHGTVVDGATLHHTRRRVAQECTLHVGCVRLRLRRLQRPEPETAKRYFREA